MGRLNASRGGSPAILRTQPAGVGQQREFGRLQARRGAESRQPCYLPNGNPPSMKRPPASLLAPRGSCRHRRLYTPLSSAPPPSMSPPRSTSSPRSPVIPDRTFTLTDFGAVGDGQTLNTDAFKKAIAAVEKAGGGKLVVPKGIFRTAPFTLCSNLDLHLDEGAVIQAPGHFRGLRPARSRRPSIRRTRSRPGSKRPTR